MLRSATSSTSAAARRTNDEGIRQLAALVAPYGRRVVAVPVAKVLHLKSGVTALPDGTVVGYEPLVDDPAAFAPFLRACPRSTARPSSTSATAPC